MNLNETGLYESAVTGKRMKKLDKVDLANCRGLAFVE
jgi:hypothetical protein